MSGSGERSHERGELERMSAEKSAQRPTLHCLDYGLLRFPVLWVGVKEFRVSFDVRHLRSALKPLRKAGLFKSGHLVDSSMQLWKVNDVVEVGPAPWFFGYRFPGCRLMVLEYFVDSPPATATMGAVIDLLGKAQRRGKYSRNAVDSPSEMEREMRQCETLAGLFDYFRCRPKPAWMWYVNERGSM